MDIEYFRRLPYSQKVWHVATNPNESAFAYDRLHLHRTSAVAQMQRIWEAAGRARAASGQPPQGARLEESLAYVQGAREPMVPVLFEIHFYLVAWTDCGHMMRTLTGDKAFLEAKKVFDSHKKTFDHYGHGRNSFEHFHDRFPGRSNANRVKERQAEGAGPRRVYFGLEGQSYKHSDKSWDVSPASLALLNGIVDGVTGLVNHAADAH